VTNGQWEHAVESARSPLGAVKSRRLASATFTRSLPGAPDGESCSRPTFRTGTARSKQ
jgi:hypothetical protein